MAFRSKRKYTPETALPLLMRHCAKQERARHEIREKLNGWEIFGDDAEKLIDQLEDLNFLNEERFAHAFARGKFRIKRWGRRKIAEHLKNKRVPDFLIKEALQAIPQDDYKATLHELLTRKLPTLRTEDAMERRNKLGQFAIRKGYEPDLVWAAVSELT